MNKIIILIILLISVIQWSGCEKGNSCTEELKMYLVEIADQNGEPVILDFFLTIQGANNDTVSCFKDLPNISPNQYLVLSDYTAYPENSDIVTGHNHVLELYNRVETFTFIGEINDSIIIQSDYQFTSDGCHIKKVQGEDQITVAL